MIEVTLQEMLDTREKRAQRQLAIFQRYPYCLVCFTMNIAGPVKDSPLICRGYAEGKRQLEEQLQREHIHILHFEENRTACGHEGFYSVDAPAERVKRLTVELEECGNFGRLLDLDVLRPDGRKVSRSDLGLPPRKCLLCDHIATECARSRAHSVAELQAITGLYLRDFFEDQFADNIAALACRALLYEVCVTPKPGLVDRNNNGSHKDMNIFSFMSSAATLESYFRQCVLNGIRTADGSPKETFLTLRWLGKSAENAMYRATSGINTHKGAIFSFGILCGAIGRLRRENFSDPKAVFEQAAAMASGLKAELSENSSTNTTGEQLYHSYGLTGVRGTVMGGFREVQEVGLPVLESALDAGYSLNDAGAIVLYHLLGTVTDTNLIRRSSITRQHELQRAIATAVRVTPFPSMQELTEIDRAFIQENLSPGGCADLLAVTWFMWFLKNGQDFMI